MSLCPPAGVARGSVAHNPGYALALRVTGLAAQSSSVRLAGQAPRLPLAKHNGHYVSSGGRAPLLHLRDALRLGAQRETRSVLRTLLRRALATMLWRRCAAGAVLGAAPRPPPR
jgi:hypothetical protein